MIAAYGVTLREKMLLKRVENAVFGALGQKNFFVVELAVTDGETVREYNREKRGIDSETDVLSFPSFDRLSLPVGKDAFKAEDFDGSRVALGSIMISRGRALKQAEDYGHSFSRELGFLFCHGMLHLLGFDHVTEDGEKEMFALTDRIMNSVGLKRRDA